MGTIQLVFDVGAMMTVFDAAPLWSWVVGLLLTVPAAVLGASWHRPRAAQPFYNFPC